MNIYIWNVIFELWGNIMKTSIKKIFIRGISCALIIAMNNVSFGNADQQNQNNNIVNGSVDQATLLQQIFDFMKEHAACFQDKDKINDNISETNLLQKIFDIIKMHEPCLLKDKQKQVDQNNPQKENVEKKEQVELSQNTQ